MRRGPFSDRALIALHDCGALDDRQLARAMKLANPTSIMAELNAQLLVSASVADRTTRPWLWRYQLTPAGREEAKLAIAHAAAERGAMEQRLREADGEYQAKSRAGHYGDGHNGQGRRR